MGSKVPLEMFGQGQGPSKFPVLDKIEEIHLVPTHDAILSVSSQSHSHLWNTSTASLEGIGQYFTNSVLLMTDQ